MCTVNTKTVIIRFNLSGSENIYLAFVNYHNKSQQVKENNKVMIFVQLQLYFQ